MISNYAPLLELYSFILMPLPNFGGPVRGAFLLLDFLIYHEIVSSVSLMCALYER